VTDPGALDPGELEDLRLVVRRFVQERIVVAERAIDPDATRLLDDDAERLRSEARSLGLWCLGSPVGVGGGGLALGDLVVIDEEAAQHRLGSYNPGAGCFGYDPPGVLVSETAPPDVQERVSASIAHGRRWFVAMTEPSGGSDPSWSVRLSARPRGSDVVLRGTKTFVSFVDDADHGLVFARDPEGRLCAFVVDADASGLTAQPLATTRPDRTYELHFDDVVVPATHRVGAVGQGADVGRRWLIEGRVRYAATCVGTARAALDLAVAYVRHRETRDGVLAESQLVQEHVARAELDVRVARLLVIEAARAASTDGEDAKSATLFAKVGATEAAGRVVDRCIQIMGGAGLVRDYPLERWMRELRIKRIGEGPTEVLLLAAARQRLRVSS
jgi:acyl-CoA dehydrogenase